MMDRLPEILRGLLAADEPTALVEVTGVRGSAPREAGACMLVTFMDSFGTIGGGMLEWEAIEAARQLLARSGEPVDMAMPLGPRLGQCCGGHVSLRILRADDAALHRLEKSAREEIAGRPWVYLFGGGHVGRALARALAPLPVRLRWIDNREDVFPDPLPPGVEAVHAVRPVAQVAAAPAGTAFIVMTHHHGLDLELTRAVLSRGDFAYAGLIGSATKRARFEKRFLEAGGRPEQWARLTCPIGGDRVADKRPAVIAALAAVEILDHLLAADLREAVSAAGTIQQGRRI